jgi:hypothetical protein
MSRSNASSSIPVVVQRQLAISGALATERLMEVHFRYAMELVEHTHQQLDPARALAIYSRLHGLRPVDTETLRHRVFVALGRRSTHSPLPASTSAPEPEPLLESPQSVLGVIRRRLRGRVNSELREWVEYHTGRAETELLWAHVENALQFIQLLDPIRNVADAVEIYTAELAIPTARTETIYYLSLAHLSGNALVSLPEGAVADDRPAAAIANATRPSLRISANRPNPGRRHSG